MTPPSLKPAEPAAPSHLSEVLDAIQQQLAGLGERVVALEAAVGLQPCGAAPPSLVASVPREELSDELIVVISAAVAAFLGVKAHVRQIHLLGSAAWAQQGRVTIQASHARPVKP